MAHSKLCPAAGRQLLLDSWQFKGGLGSGNCTFSVGEYRSVLFFAKQRFKCEGKNSAGAGKHCLSIEEKCS